MTSDPNQIPENVQKTEQSFVWLIQNVVRGSWFRRLVFLLFLVAAFASPPVVTHAFSFFGEQPPHWYSAFYAVGVGLLVIVTVIVGAITIPPPPPPRPKIDSLAVRGLLPFNLEDSILFAQLERGVELQRVHASVVDAGFRFGILVGTSGTGKTSFLRAGLLAQLLESRVSATYVELSNENPLTSIQREVARQNNGVTTGVLLLDQFEQFFLHWRTADERRPMIDALAAWYLPNSGVRVLISIRAEDAWQTLEIQESLDYQLSNRNYFKLPKFSMAQAVEVLRILCDMGGIAFDKAFASKIVDRELRDPEDGLVSPVSLGIVILVLATGRHALTPESFKAYRGIEGLFETWLDSQLEAAKYQGLDRNALSTLTALCDFDRDRRSGILTIADITKSLAGDLTLYQVRRAVQWLSGPDVRLIVPAGENFTGYQLVNERLIRAIRKAAGKLLDDAAGANDLLERRVGEWVKNNRSSRFLLTLFEYRRVERQRPYLIWGETRADKESLLKRTRVRWQRRVAFAAMAIVVLLTGYEVWGSNPVQRRYIEWRLGRLAKSYATEDVALALAALGDLPKAKDVANKVRDDDPDRKPLARGMIAVEAAKTAVARQDQALLGQALEIVEELNPEWRSDPMKQIAVEMARVGLARKDQTWLERAQQLIEKLDPGDGPEALQEIAGEAVKIGDNTKAIELLEQAVAQTLEQAVAQRGFFRPVRPRFERSFVRRGTSGPMYSSLNVLQQIAVEMAKAGQFDRAKQLAETINPTDDARSDSLQQIAVEMAKAGQFDKMKGLAETLGGKRSSVVGKIAVEVAKVGVARSDRSLLGRAKTLAETLDPEDRSSALQEISVEMAKLGRVTKDQEMLNQAHELAKTLNWEGEPVKRWKIAVMIDDGTSTQYLLNQVYLETQEDSEDQVKHFPQAMAELGALKDQKLLESVRKEVKNLDPGLRFETLLGIAVEAAKVWGAAKVKELLEQAFEEGENLGSTRLYFDRSSIAEEMAKLGYLKRAREIAESASGLEEMADGLAGIVLADVEVSRSSQPRRSGTEARKDGVRGFLEVMLKYGFGRGPSSLQLSGRRRTSPPNVTSPAALQCALRLTSRPSMALMKQGLLNSSDSSQ